MRVIRTGKQIDDHASEKPIEKARVQTDLTQRIKDAGYTILQVCQLLAVSRTAFYNYRTGKRPMPKDIRDHLRQLLLQPSRWP